MNTTASVLCRATLALSLAAASAGDGWAQTPPGAGRGAPARVPVSVALVERLPVPDAPFVLLRDADAEPRDVILLPVDATPEVLSEAIEALLVVRHQRGDQPEESGIVRLARPSGQSRARPRLPWAPRVLADLRRAPAREIGGVGTVPVVEIWLPRQRRL
jgi:hypothetical protein